MLIEFYQYFSKKSIPWLETLEIHKKQKIPVGKGVDLSYRLSLSDKEMLIAARLNQSFISQVSKA